VGTTVKGPNARCRPQCAPYFILYGLLFSEKAVLKNISTFFKLFFCHAVLTCDWYLSRIKFCKQHL